MRTKWKQKYHSLRYDMEKVAEEIKEEILKRPKHSNVGKKGCLRRLNAVIQFHNVDVPKYLS